jgi:hypothetical protein
MTMSPCIASKCAVEGLTETALLEYVRAPGHAHQCVAARRIRDGEIRAMDAAMPQVLKHTRPSIMSGVSAFPRLMPEQPPHYRCRNAAG